MFKPIIALTLFTAILGADVAFAQMTDINLPVTVQKGESYQGLLARASQLAGETIEERFQALSTVDRVKLTVTAENAGEIAPLLLVNVSRQDWASNPNIRRWANVFPFGKELLGFESPRPPVASSSPPPAPPAATPAAAKPPTGTPPAGTPPTGTPPAGTPSTGTPAATKPAPIPWEEIPSDSTPAKPAPMQRLQPPAAGNPTP